MFIIDTCWYIRYEVVFQQSVGAEDVFLCMAGNTPATASCHHQLVSNILGIIYYDMT